jgi:hypothetical protein
MKFYFKLLDHQRVCNWNAHLVSSVKRTEGKTTNLAIRRSYYVQMYVFFLCFLHRPLWYNYTAWTKEIQTFQINTLIKFFNF